MNVFFWRMLARYDARNCSLICDKTRPADMHEIMPYGLLIHVAFVLNYVYRSLALILFLFFRFDIFWQPFKFGFNVFASFMSAYCIYPSFGCYSSISFLFFAASFLKSFPLSSLHFCCFSTTCFNHSYEKRQL